MTKAIIFDSEEHAKQWDYEHNSLEGSVSTYRYNRIPLKATTTLTKAEYAELYNIPATIVLDEEGNETPNPQYTALESSYTLDKYALIVGDAFATYDEEGNLTGHSEDVVEISESDLKQVSEE